MVVVGDGRAVRCYPSKISPKTKIRYPPRSRFFATAPQAAPSAMYYKPAC